MDSGSEGDYLTDLEKYYSDRLKAGLKKKHSVCKGCEGSTEFRSEQGVLYYICGSCGLHMKIELAKYLYFPEVVRTHLLVSNLLDKSKHPDLYSKQEIQEQEQFLNDSDQLLKQATLDYKKVNKINQRQTMIQSIHKDRMNYKKEQAILMNKINQEIDLSKKKLLMKEYISINQMLLEGYKKLTDECTEVEQFLLVGEGSSSHKKEKVEKKKPVKRLGKALNKNLIPQLQGLEKEPNNNMRLNLIVAYRDPGDGSRRSQLKQFKEQMKLIFDEQTDLHIYIIEQEGKREDYGSLPELIKQENSQMAKFNLGILKNIGFAEAVKQSKNKDKTYYILTDVDLLPSLNLVKDYLKYPETPIHLANKGTRYNMDGHDQKFLGGVISVNQDDFVKANGYPNNFWGWGGEDNALNYRFNKNNIRIEKSEEPVIDLENMSIGDKMTKLKTEKLKEMRKWEKLDEDKQSWKDNGLSNLEGKYKIKRLLKGNNIKHYKVFLNVD